MFYFVDFGGKHESWIQVVEADASFGDYFDRELIQAIRALGIDPNEIVSMVGTSENFHSMAEHMAPKPVEECLSDIASAVESHVRSWHWRNENRGKPVPVVALPAFRKAGL